MTSSSPIGMRFQFRTLTFHSRSKEQLQERVCLNKSVTSLPATIGELGFPLGPHPESELAIDLYSGSTLIANMDESNHRISFNCLNKSAILLLMVIEASRSPLGPRPKRDLAKDLYPGSTPIAIKDESNHQISFRRLQEIYTSLQEVIKSKGSPLGTPPKIDLAIYRSIL
jgi:hypothetical protein